MVSSDRKKLNKFFIRVNRAFPASYNIIVADGNPHFMGLKILYMGL